MQQPSRRIDIEAEKKKNVTIAIVIAASGIVMGIVLYIGMFVVMFAFPFAFFSFIPIPVDHKDMISIDGKLLLFTEKMDFKGASFGKEPQQRTFMSEFDGDDFTRPIEIEPFHTIALHKGKLYFFTSGRYRVYDMAGWEKFENAAIGDTPKGTVSEEGVWILSNLIDRPALVLLNEGLAIDVPLPLGRHEEKDVRICSSRIVWFDGELHLFWNKGGPLVHEIYDGRDWRTGGYFEAPGELDILEAGGKLLLFSKKTGEGFSVRSFEGGEWSAPRKIKIDSNEFNIGFQVAEFEGKPAVLVNNVFLSKKLYLIEDEKVVKTYTIGSLLKNTFSGWMIYFNALCYAISALFVFIVSAIISRYKLTYWQHERGRVRFASIFRRFLAYTIDTILVTLPFGIFGYYIFRQGFPPENPFMFMGLIFVAVGGIILFKFLYFSLLEGLRGKTVGKWICGIMVLRDDFTRCSLGWTFLRNLLRVVDAMFYYFVALICIGATLKWQRLGDLAAGTVVVRVKRRGQT